MTCPTEDSGAAAFWSGTVERFLQTATGEIVGTLTVAQVRHFRLNETHQLRAWEATIGMLRRAFSELPTSMNWYLLLEYPMLRLGRRPDIILLTEHVIFVIEVKAEKKAFTPENRRQVEDYAIDLHDFHSGCRANPIVPILLAEEGQLAPQAVPFLFNNGVLKETLEATSVTLPGLLEQFHRQAACVSPRLDATVWLAAEYRPVPTIIDAACMLCARHNVADIRSARSDTNNLTATSAEIQSQINEARAAGQRLILFVTGIPGAGKTLCGLNAIFGDDDGARGTYLTGNPTLVHVLREALVRDAVTFRTKRSDAVRRMQGAIQALPKFRDHYVAHPDHVPSEHVVVIDEAQRCWSAAWATAKTRDKPIRLTQSEPAHLLEIMSRHDGFCALVCLVGGGQEIHDGEGGLAEWGHALRRQATQGTIWKISGPPDLVQTTDPRQDMGPLAGIAIVPTLHLAVPVRQIRSTAAAAWVDALLAGDATGAGQIARQAGGIPFLLTRDSGKMKAWLRKSARGLRRSGLLASSGAARLRAEGLGSELPHMDASAVVHWFLDRFPDDVRASDALETIATEFSCQGLELDYVGLCWDADFIRETDRTAWRVRNFRGTKWQLPRQTEAIANQVNTYRVLLTRARYDTVIFVPRGDPDDPTRVPEYYDQIAAFLLACGVRPLAPEVAVGEPRTSQPSLL